LGFNYLISTLKNYLDELFISYGKYGVNVKKPEKAYQEFEKFSDGLKKWYLQVSDQKTISFLKLSRCPIKFNNILAVVPLFFINNPGLCM
jgi:hypothetical protein